MRGLLADQKEAIEERCETLASLQAWPGTADLNWRGWLENFRSDELPFARSLLEAFCYFGRPQANALLRAAFHSISREIVEGSTSRDEARERWREFLTTAIVTYVEGETPAPTDSGYTFARRARGLLGIPDARIVFPVAAARIARASPSTPIVFVDDFVGSGNQFVRTWHRSYPELGNASFRTLGLTNAWYVPLIATWKGADRVTRNAAGVRLRPAHLITEEYSTKSDISIIWRPGEYETARRFVEQSSARAGYHGAEAWGFHELGLAVAVEDTIPDFSLPLFFSTRGGWIPLMRRPS